MASLKSISSAIVSADAKKDNLRKAFEDLQSHSSSLSTFTLQWKDLEDHFDSIKKSIDGRFKELESKTKQDGSVEKQPSPSSTPVAKPESNSHPEMKTLCTKMDALGLRGYILNHRKELASIREEIGTALKLASDPAKLVLEAMKGYYPANSKGDKDSELAALRRTCLLLLEQLFEVSPQIKPDIKDKAQKLAVEWKGKVSSGGENPLEQLGLLQLVATYGLVSSFAVDEVLELAIHIARRKQAVDLIRSLGFADKVPDFIQKLNSKGKQLEAIKFVYAFELVDKIPPVPLLKDYFKEAKKIAQEVRNKGNNSSQSVNEAIAKEMAAVKAIIKCLEEHKLESEYPRAVLDKRVEQLEKQKADKKRPANVPTPDKQQQNSGNKRPRPTSSTLPSHPHLGGLDRFPSSYLSSSAQYALGGTNPSVPSFMSGGAGPYGLGSNPNSMSSLGLGLGGNPASSYGMNLSPPRSHLYPSESQLTSGLYDRAMNYGGPGMPPTHRSIYYP